MNTLKMTIALTLMLLVGQSTHVKASIISRVVTGVAIAGISIYMYIKYKDECQSNSDKFIDQISNDTKTLVNKTKDVTNKVIDAVKKS